jgi:hypothetical protein
MTRTQSAPRSFMPAYSGALEAPPLRSTTTAANPSQKTLQETNRHLRRSAAVD